MATSSSKRGSTICGAAAGAPRPTRCSLLRKIVRLEERLEVSVELASPLDVFHLEFASQALSKLERGFEQDLADVDSMVAARVVDPDELSRLFALVARRFPHGRVFCTPFQERVGLHP